MSKSSALAGVMENFINSWNHEFPNFELTVEDLKRPHAVMGALFHIFDRIGIDREAVLQPPPEGDLNAHIGYYWDLLPVINMTRVINHLMPVQPQIPTITINHFLQPSAHASHSILLLLFNLMIFNEGRLQSIVPYEEELFKFSDMVKELEEKKNDLIGQLNTQAIEQAKRAGKMEQMNQEIQQLEEEIRQEELLKEQEKHELDVLIKENNMSDVMVDQKRATKEGLLAERERKKVLRVYDAEDVRSQAARAVQNLQETEEKVNALTAVLAQKEKSLQTLQIIRPNLDTANNLLHDIQKLKDYELADIDEESKDGELELLNTDLMELQAQVAELTAREAEDHNKRREAQAQRQHEHTCAESALREAEEKDKKRREFTKKATQRTEEIKQDTLQFQQEKAQGFEDIQKLKRDYDAAIKEWEEALMKLVTEVKMKIDEKKPFDLE